MTKYFCTGCHDGGIFDEAVQLTIKTYCIDYDVDRLVRATSYGSYCRNCATQYELGGFVLHNEQEEQDWLSGKTPDIEQQ